MATYYLAPLTASPAGSDSNAGTIGSPWFSLNKVWTVIAPGDIIYMRGGIYLYTEQQWLHTTSGTIGNPIEILAYSNEHPIISRNAITFTLLYAATAFSAGVLVYLDYTHWDGIDFKGFFQEDTKVGTGIRFINSNYNLIENCHSYDNGGVGIAFYNFDYADPNAHVTGNMVINCDAYNNKDPNSSSPYGNGDGIQIAFINHVDDSNLVSGCRSWYNSDDGFDCFLNRGYISYINCWSYHNGYREDETTVGGNGTGFKLGPSATLWNTPGSLEANRPLTKRIVQNCVAVANGDHGYNSNMSECGVEIDNSDAYLNQGMGFKMTDDHAYYSGGWTPGVTKLAHTLRNNIAYANVGLNANINGSTPSTIQNNTFLEDGSTGGTYVPNPAFTLSGADFINLTASELLTTRQPDGSLPIIDFLHLVDGSDLIDGGINIGLPFNGSAPDVGAFESDYGDTTTTTTTTAAPTSSTTTTTTTHAPTTTTTTTHLTTTTTTTSTTHVPTTTTTSTTTPVTTTSTTTFHLTTTTTTSPITTTSTTTVEVYNQCYGLLYNWFAATDARGICPAGWHLPTEAEALSLILNWSSPANRGAAMAQRSLLYWQYLYNATNSSGFSGRGAGYRDFDGSFSSFQSEAHFHLSNVLSGNDIDRLNVYQHAPDNSFYSDINIGESNGKKKGYSIRLIKNNSTNLGTVTDYDGNVYTTVKIGTQVWMAESLIVEHFNNGAVIPNITNGSSWAALTSAGLCAYNNDWDFACTNESPAATTTTTTTSTSSATTTTTTTTQIPITTTTTSTTEGIEISTTTTTTPLPTTSTSTTTTTNIPITTTSSTTRIPGTHTEYITRKVVSLTDPKYFCNRSWTLSYNVNTKSWTSFHSYIPNWYIAENNFFYSGINGCCEEFEFVAGTIIANPPITTTTTIYCNLDVIIPTTTTTTTTTELVITPDALELTWDDIVNVPVADASSVSDWNTFFNLPTNGGVFTSVTVIGNVVKLYGGSGIILKANLFFDNKYLLSIIDNIPCIISMGNNCFQGCDIATIFDFPSLVTVGDYCFYNNSSAITFNFPLLTTAGTVCFAFTPLTTYDFPSLVTAGDSCFAHCLNATTFSFPLLTTAERFCFSSNPSIITYDFPSLVTAGDYCFQLCNIATTFNFPSLVTIGYVCFYGLTSVTNINIPVCTSLGPTVGDDFVFASISGQTITLTIPTALMTCNTGNPDGDIQYLAANNTVTIITV